MRRVSFEKRKRTKTEVGEKEKGNVKNNGKTKKEMNKK